MKKNSIKKRLSKVAKEFNLGISTITDFLNSRGFNDSFTPNYKITQEQYDLLLENYGYEKNLIKKVQKAKEKAAQSKKEMNTIKEEKEKKKEKEEAIIINNEKVANKEEKIEVTQEAKEEKKEANIEKTEKNELSEDKKVEIIDKEIEAKEEEQILKKETVEEKKKEGVEDKKDDKKKEEKQIKIEKIKEKVEVLEDEQEGTIKQPKILGKINLDDISKKSKKEKKTKKKVKVKKFTMIKSVKTLKENKKIKTKKRNEEDETILKEKVTVKETEKVIEKGVNEVIKEVIEKDDIKQKEKEVQTDTNEEIENNTFVEKKEIIKDDIKVVGKIDLSTLNQKTRPARKTKKEKEAARKRKEGKKKETKITKVKSLKVTKVNLPETSKKDSDAKNKTQKRRKRKTVEKVEINKVGQVKSKYKIIKKRPKKLHELDKKDIDKQVKETLAKLEGRQKNKAAQYRKDRREEHKLQRQKKQDEVIEQQKIIEVTEFITVNELANMLDIHVNKVIETCMDMNIPVSINYRLDADTITIIAEEYGFAVDFISTQTKDEIDNVIIEEDEENLEPRPAIITVMGHVDHGKTSLLDFIRKTNVIDGEAGGITQHIGAYHVTLKDDQVITFLDTPGHEAFTAMRARGAKVTDVAIIIIAADDNIMPQTIEAIDHAKAAEVPIVFAINKIDKENADVERIKRELADRNILIEEWGGTYGCVEISAKHGKNIDGLLERVILEAEMLELKANPNRNAIGTVIESALNKGRGYISTLLLQTGSLKVGDIVLAGRFYGRVKALFNERDRRIKSVGPSEPVVVLGLGGAPEAGDPFIVLDSEKDAKEKANYRQQMQREMSFRAKKFLTLDEIGRRIKVGEFKELNLVIKGDVIGSIEALADSVSKLSTDEIQVNIIHKAVGQISYNDIMLASASKAIVIAFQVRASHTARAIAEKEQIEIRHYSVIFNAINEIKDAMEGMLSPEIKEEIVGTAEILQVFKISKVGTIAGCMLKDGKINRNSTVRLIRDGIVKYTGELGSLKRFKDDAKEVQKGYECGLNLERYNDIKVGDFIEAYIETQVKKTL